MPRLIRRKVSYTLAAIPISGTFFNSSWPYRTSDVASCGLLESARTPTALPHPRYRGMSEANMCQTPGYLPLFTGCQCPYTSASAGSDYCRTCRESIDPHQPSLVTGKREPRQWRIFPALDALFIHADKQGRLHIHRPAHTAIDFRDWEKLYALSGPVLQLGISGKHVTGTVMRVSSSVAEDIGSLHISGTINDKLPGILTLHYGKEALVGRPGAILWFLNLVSFDSCLILTKIKAMDDERSEFSALLDKVVEMLLAKSRHSPGDEELLRFIWLNTSGRLPTGLAAKHGGHIASAIRETLNVAKSDRLRRLWDHITAPEPPVQT